MAPLTLSDFDYDLPAESIAQTPAERRDESRLLVLDRKTGAREHRRFRDLGAYLQPGDLLVLNDTRVIPARLFGTRATGARIEVLLLSERARDTWQCMVRPGRKAPVGTLIRFGDDFVGRITAVTPDGLREIALEAREGVERAIATYGELPLPPYIADKPLDAERYQTVYAREQGAVAAPTAGLHFTSELLDSLGAQGILTTTVTLHTGMGTFKPVTVEDVTTHPMHSERYRIGPDTVQAVRAAKARGNRVVAVGTTAVRTLEHAAQHGALAASSGETSIFIYPGYRFRVVDALITNFHLPKSTLLMLVSAFAEQVSERSGRELMLETYQEAIRHGYRFYSFGDATLML